jgi:pyruvate-formate lyase-activating enzyme
MTGEEFYNPDPENIDKITKFTHDIHDNRQSISTYVPNNDYKNLAMELEELKKLKKLKEEPYLEILESIANNIHADDRARVEACKVLLEYA